MIVGTGGSTPHAVLTLAADDVKVSGFTITSQSYSNTSQYAYGIWVEGDNCIISNNTIANTYIGLWGSTPTSTTITQNTITRKYQRRNSLLRQLPKTPFQITTLQVTPCQASQLTATLNTITNNSITNNFRGIGFRRLSTGIIRQ